MDFLTAIIAGLLQGIFEWLPISSQGNLLGIFSLLGMSVKDALKLAVMLHIGTLLAAIVYFKEDIFEIFISLKEKLLSKKETKNWQLSKFLIVATLATGITAIPSYLFLKQMLGFGISYVLVLLGILLLVTGFLQWFKIARGDGELNLRNGFFTGLGQGFSALPGVSRSGTTTAVLTFVGFEPEKAFRISFLMSIPSILLAEVGIGLIEGFVIDIFAIVALVVAFAIGLASMDLLIKFAKRINFSYFCFFLAILYFGAALIV